MFNKNKTVRYTEKHVTCEHCKCWLNEEDAQRVKTPFLTHYYCQAHKVPYSRIKFDFYSDTPRRYFKEVEVTEDGEPVGFTKVKK